jgi:lysozyme
MHRMLARQDRVAPGSIRGISDMQTSAKGRADLKLHEGEVLKAYRDPVGVLTIGVGITSAAGVVKVTPGMVITREESDRLLTEALDRAYEPRVRQSMVAQHGGKVALPKQHEFDAAVGFDYNTGAIHKASWVKAWRLKDWPGVEKRLKLWKKGGGKVLPGLVRRRQAEFDLMRYGRYASDAAALHVPDSPKVARITLQLSPGELEAVRDGLRKLGFDPGTRPGQVAKGAVVAFQLKHDLTVDGILGRATLSTLQRALDARAKSTPAAGGVGVSVGAEAGGADELLKSAPWLVDAALILCVLYALWLAWHYRDQLAAAVQSYLPRVAAFLRSF